MISAFSERDGKVDLQLGLSYSSNEGVVQHRYPGLSKISEMTGAAILVGLQQCSAFIHPFITDTEITYMPSAKTRRRVGYATISGFIALNTSQIIF